MLLNVGTYFMSPKLGLMPNIKLPNNLFQSFLDSTLAPVFSSVSGVKGQPEQSPSITILLCSLVFLVTAYFLPAISMSIVNDQLLSSFLLSVSPLLAPRQKCMISTSVDLPNPFLES